VNREYTWEETYGITNSILNCQTVGDIRDKIIIPVCDGLGATSAAFGHWDSSSSLLDEQFNDSYRIPEINHSEYYERFYQQDPVIESIHNKFSHPLANKNQSLLLSLHDICDFRRLKSTAYYLDFLKPMDIEHVAVLAFRPSMYTPDVYILGIHRKTGQKPFQASDLDQFKRLSKSISHVISKLALEKHIERDKTLISTLEENSDHLGIMILNNNFEHVYSNQIAAKYFKISANKFVAGNVGKKLTRQCEKLKNNFFSQKKNNSITNQEQLDSRYNIEIRHNENGNIYFLITIKTPNIDELIYTRGTKMGLTSRELEISFLTSKGMTNEQLSNELNITVRTVETHLRTIYKKVNVHNRSALINRLAHH